MTQTAKSHDPNSPKLHQGSYTVTFAAGETHTLDLRAYAQAAKPLLVQFRWITPEWQQAKIDEAVAAAQGASKVIFFAYDEGTEGSDRGGNSVAAGLTLPGYQDQVIAAVAAANPNTVVVLNTGDPVLMPWVNSVKAILEMWYPGQMGGVATANILLGKVNPGGKLPVTFRPAPPPTRSMTPTATRRSSPATRRLTATARSTPASTSLGSWASATTTTRPSTSRPTASSSAIAGTTSTT